MERRRALKLFASSPIFMLPGCSLVFGRPKLTFRYRMTVEVQTPQGLRTGSTVREVTVMDARFMGHDLALTRGEAVCVDLPNKKTLFVALRDSDPADDRDAKFVLATLYPEGKYFGETSIRDASIAIESKSVFTYQEAIEIYEGGQTDTYPPILYFDNILNPETIKIANPDNLAAKFGVGYKINRITIQITDDPITTGILKRLPWLNGYSAWLTVGDNRFGAEQFSTEAVKERLPVLD